MPRNTALLIFLLIVVAGVTGYNYFIRPFQRTSNPASEFVASPSPQVLSQVEKKFVEMSESEKVAQLMLMPVALSSDAKIDLDDQEVARTLQPAGLIVFADAADLESATEQVTSLREELEIPGFVAVDHEGGTVQRLSGEGYTRLPSWQELCQQPVASISAQIERSAFELSQSGINMVLAPVVDVAAQNPVLKSRICSNDPFIVGERAQVAMVAYQRAGIIPVLKHYPGLGQSTVDTHQGFQAVPLPVRELTVYRRLLDIYPRAAVMVSHIGIEELNSSTPCSLSQACIEQLRQVYPQALVITDALEMDAAGFTGRLTAGRLSGTAAASGSATLDSLTPLPDRAAAAIMAGNHILLFGDGVTAVEFTAIHQQLVGLYQENDAFRLQVDKSVKEVLGYKQQTIGLSVP